MSAHLTPPQSNSEDGVRDRRAKWTGGMRQLLSWSVDLLVPTTCLSCNERLSGRDAICPCCWTSIDFICPPLCDRLGLPMPYDPGGTIVSAAAVASPPIYDRARAVAHYSGAMADLIRMMKYADSQNARVLFGRWLSSAGRDLIDDCEVIVPVPMHRWRLLQRKFNQAALLAQQVARTNDRAYAPTLLVRQRATRSQVGLTRNQRHRNLAGAFSISKRQRAQIAGRRVLLVDDVITTGTTLNACARTLKNAGASKVDALALALATGAPQIRV